MEQKIYTYKNNKKFKYENKLALQGGHNRKSVPKSKECGN